jgi:hypothetical protein
MADSRNLGYMIPNEGNGWETKYSVALANRANIKVIEYQSNGRVAPVIEYYGSAAIVKAVLDLYNGFPIGTLFINRTVAGIYIKKTDIVWNAITTTTPITAVFSALVLTTPADNDTTNNITLGGSGAARTATVSAVTATDSVVLTGTKTLAQNITIGGAGEALVSVADDDTVTPIFTIDTDAIKTTGGAVIFTITLSETGLADVVYTVTVTVAASSAKAITAFSFAGLSPVVVGAITEGTHTIALEVPALTSVIGLISTFTLSAGATLKVSATAQVSGTTPNNFTSPVTYTVTAADTSTQNYVVTVTVAT